jgi:hypothetical protein
LAQTTGCADALESCSLDIESGWHKGSLGCFCSAAAAGASGARGASAVRGGSWRRILIFAGPYWWE